MASKQFSKLKIDQSQEDKVIFNQFFKDLISTFQAIQSDKFLYDNKLQMFIVKKKYETILTTSMLKYLSKVNEISWMFMRIQKLINQTDKNQISVTYQSLIGALKSELAFFYEFLSMMENYHRSNNFGSQNFFTTLEILTEEVAEKLKDLAYIIESSAFITSTEILSFLFILSKNSILDRKQYIYKIFIKVNRPFLEFINNWINHGEIFDPKNEFFVRKKKKSIKEDEYWNKGLKFIEDKIPYFLKKEIAKIIFDIGKEICVLKMIDINFVIESKEKITLDELLSHTNRLHLVKKLQKIFEKKTKTLLNFVFEQKKIMDIFVDAKGIFMTMRGDFINTFI